MSAFVPPPPPPPSGGFPPPPPPASSSMSKTKSSSSSNRAALLADIRNVPKLKKSTVVNDRSAPILSSSNSANNSNSNSKPSPSGNVAPSPLGLGGLFANGMPKLKATGSRLLPEKTSQTNSSSSLVSKPNFTINKNQSETNLSSLKSTNSSFLNRQNPSSNSSSNFNPSSNFNLRENVNSNSSSSSPDIAEGQRKFGALSSNGSASGGNLKNSWLPKEASPGKTVGSSIHRSHNSLNTLAFSSNPKLPNKPVSPQKFHTISSRKHHSSNKTNDSTMPAHKGQAPLPPNQKPSLQRSNSQNSSRPSSHRPSPKPPNIKPPPPPKQGLEFANPAQQVAPPPPPAQINVNGLRPNNLGSNNSTLHGSLAVQQKHQQPIKPPAPPRNSSYPNSLSNSTEQPRSRPALSNSTSCQPSSHKVIRPPPGPPPPPPNRVSSVVTGNQTLRANGTNATNNLRLNQKSVAPPVPNHILERASNNNENFPPPPLPPIRNTSISKETFENRLKFRDICELPAPQPMRNLNKVYPSQMQKNRRREPPPPPPPAMTTNGPMANYSGKQFHILINRESHN